MLTRAMGKETAKDNSNAQEPERASERLFLFLEAVDKKLELQVIRGRYSHCRKMQVSCDRPVPRLGDTCTLLHTLFSQSELSMQGRRWRYLTSQGPGKAKR
jgi:hypothetical protein